MKQISLIVLGVLALTLQTTSAFTLNGEFITGFESGIFLRNSEEIYDDYGCPKARPSGGLSNLNQIIGPLKMVGALAKDKNIEHLISTVEVFVDSLSSLLAVFTNYDGGEFCSGLIFGSNGAHMLTNIAKTLVQISNRGKDSTPARAAIGNDRDRDDDRSGKYRDNDDSGSLKNKFNRKGRD